jgi:hypothetical protein
MKHSILTKQDNCSLSLIICFTENEKEQEILPVVAGSAGGAGIVLIAQWFSLATPVSSTNKTDRQDIFEILLKVVYITINLNQTQKYYNNII